MQISHNYTYIPSLLSLPPLPPSLISRPSQSTWLGSLCYTTTSHQLFILHMIVYIYIYVNVHSQSLNSVHLGWDLKFCISPLFPGEPDGLSTIFGTLLSQPRAWLFSEPAAAAAASPGSSYYLDMQVVWPTPDLQNQSLHDKEPPVIHMTLKSETYCSGLIVLYSGYTLESPGQRHNLSFKISWRPVLHP